MYKKLNTVWIITFLNLSQSCPHHPSDTARLLTSRELISLTDTLLLIARDPLAPHAPRCFNGLDKGDFTCAITWRWDYATRRSCCWTWETTVNDDAGAGGDAGGDRNCSALSSTSVHRTSPDRSAVAQTPPPAPVKRTAHNITTPKLLLPRLSSAQHNNIINQYST